MPQTNDKSCKVCWHEYSPSDDENLPWVMCDLCELWTHIECIPIGVDQTPIDNDDQFFVLIAVDCDQLNCHCHVRIEDDECSNYRFVC